MAHFEATVQLLDMDESDASAALRAVEERLRVGGFHRWRVVRLGAPSAAPRVGARGGRSPRGAARYSGGDLMFFGIAAWAMWFLWLLVS